MRDAIAYITVIAAVVIGLVALVEWLNTPSAAEINTIRQSLPAGCEFRDLGSYGDINHVVAVICDGRKVSSISHIEYHGKYSRSGLTVTIDG
ncbi:hypothetical protein D3C86_1220890 [compost metagenome]